MSGLFPFLPMFIDVTGRAAVLLSGADAMVPLARRLLDAGAAIKVVDPSPSQAMEALGVRLARRGWRPLDFEDAVLVVAGAREPRAPQARAAARHAGAIFAMPGAGAPADPAFGASAAWGSVSVGVHGGSLPGGVNEAIAARIDALAPPDYAHFLAAVERGRVQVESALAAPAARDAFWRAAASDAFAASPVDWDAWLRDRLSRT